MTAGSSTDLLRALAGAGRLGAPGASLSPPKLQSAGFAELLQQAQRGEFGSGLPVTIARDAAVELTDEQLARLAVVADAAEAQGATRALVVIDGKALRLDVGSRTVLGAVDLASGALATGIDAVIHVPATGPEQPRLIGPGADAAGMNQTLLRILGRG